MKKQYVWVVMHHEFFGVYDENQEVVGHAQDGIIMHVSSTLKRAEKFIVDVMVDPFSWWGITRGEVDHHDWITEGNEKTRWYTYKGKFVKEGYNPPARVYNQALRAYKKRI